MAGARQDDTHPLYPAPIPQLLIGVDATPANHVWHDAPKRIAFFCGPPAARQLWLVWLQRETPRVAKFLPARLQVRRDEGVFLDCTLETALAGGA